MKKIVCLFCLSLLLVGCFGSSQEDRDRETVDAQQAQFAKRQPIPAFNWSLERHLVSELYKIRNQKATTHAVWRSDHGMIEDDCPCLGYGIPYDTSLTNPLQSEWGADGSVAIEQAEPNGIFASKNTAATWVMCIGQAGLIEPVYVESKVTIYPYPVKIDYQSNRVIRDGKASVTIKKN